MKNTILYLFFLFLFILQVDLACATEFEKLGDAIGKALGTLKVFKSTVGSDLVYYSKGANGKAEHFAVIQKGIYEPNCTHTWVIGVNANGAVDGIRVVEMSCPHAFPTRQSSYLDQYKGKGTKDTTTLKSEVHTVAKATGSSNLTTDAVVKSIKIIQSLRGKI